MYSTAQMQRRTREFELSSDNKFVLGSLNSRASWFSSDSQLQWRILACASRSQVVSHECVCQFTSECRHFSPYEKSKSCLHPEVFSYLVYSQSTILFLENSLKNPPDSFSRKQMRSRPPSVPHFLWNLWKLRGVPRKYPRVWKTLLVSGSWLKLTWPMFGSQRSKYSNRAVTYSNRTTLELVCLEGSQLSSGLCLRGSLEGPDLYLCASTAQGSVIAREDHSRICHLECSRVTMGYLHIEHYTSVLTTRKIMRARAVLHLSGSVSGLCGTEAGNLFLLDRVIMTRCWVFCCIFIVFS